MSNKIKGLTVSLDKDISEEYADHLISVIKSIKGVCDVTKDTSNTGDFLIQSRYKRTVIDKLFKLIDEL